MGAESPAPTRSPFRPTLDVRGGTSGERRKQGPGALGEPEEFGIAGIVQLASAHALTLRHRPELAPSWTLGGNFEMHHGCRFPFSLYGARTVTGAHDINQ